MVRHSRFIKRLFFLLGSVLLVGSTVQPVVALRVQQAASETIYMPMMTAAVQIFIEVSPGSASEDGISGTPDASFASDLLVTSDGDIIIAWEEVLTPNNTEIYLKMFDGNNWKEVGTGSASGGGISKSAGLSVSPKLAMSSDGTLYLAWRENGIAVYVLRWDGNSWGEVTPGSASGLGLIQPSVDNTTYLDMIAGLDGDIFLAWINTAWVRMGTTNERISIIRVIGWDGSDWVEVGAGSASGTGVVAGQPDREFRSISLAIGPETTPCFTWQDMDVSYFHPPYGTIYLLCWNGIEWAELGNQSASGEGLSTYARGPVLELGQNNELYLAWVQYTGGLTEIYVRRWNGVSWEEIGLHSASGSGLSQAIGQSDDPALAHLPDGSLYVFWRNIQWLASIPGLNINFVQHGIYVRRWNGSEWEEIAGRSARGQGISYYTPMPYGEIVASAQDGTVYAAWGTDFPTHTDCDPCSNVQVLKIHPGYLVPQDTFR